MRFFEPVTLALVLLLVGACASNAPEPALREAPSFDGLIPLSSTVMERVWIRQGFTLSGYHKVILDSARIQFRPVTRRTGDGLLDPATEFPLSVSQREEISRLISEAFGTSLERLTLERVTEPGPGVLRVRGTLLDLAVREADDGRHRYRIDPIGQLTFSVELIDSQTDTVLLRAVDTRAARMPGAPYPSESASGTSPVRQIIDRWADLLVDALNDLTALDQLQGA